MRTILLLALTAILSLGVGIGGYLGFERWQSASEDAVTLRPEFELPNLDGELKSITQWDGQIIALNFWASWCPPCIREIPHFVELQNEYADQGVQFIGVAVDRVEEARRFAEDLGMNYPLMYGVQRAMEVSERYGNVTGTLPYTVLIDRDGAIRDVFPYEVDRETIEAAIKKLL